MKNKHSKELIKIKVIYLSKDLQQITGKKKEIIRVPKTFRSGDFFDLLQERYPEIFKKFGPGYLGFTLNEEKPHVLTLLKEGDQYKFITWTDEEIFQSEIQQNGDEYGEVDYEYTKYILNECFKILKKVLNELVLLESPQKLGLIVALARLSKIEEKISSI